MIDAEPPFVERSAIWNVRVARHGELFAIGSTSFILILGMSLVAPVLPLYADDLDVSAGAIGLAIAAFSFGQVLFAPFGALVSAKIGVRFTAVTAGVVTGTTALAAASVDSYVPFLIMRVVQGGGTGLYTTVALGRLLDITPQPTAGRVLSRYQGAQLIAVSMGPVLGGWTAELWGLHAPFVLWGVLSLAGTVGSALAMPSGRPCRDREPKLTGRIGNLGGLSRHVRFRTAMIVTLVVFWARQGVRNTALPLVAADEFAMSPGFIGTVMMAATLLNAAALPHAGRVIDRRGWRPVMIWGTFVAAASVAAIALATGPWTLAMITVLVGVTTGYATICSAAVVAELRPGQRPAAVGVQRVLAQGGQAIGTVTVALLIQGLGFRAAAVAAGLVLAVTAAYALVLMPRVAPSVAPKP